MSKDQTDARGQSALARFSYFCDRGLALIEKVTLGLAVASLFAIMGLIFVDGLLRYVANSPLTFVVDIVVLYLISAGFLLVMSYTMRQGGHINVDVFVHLMSPRAQRFCSGIALLCAVPIVGIMTVETLKLTWESYEQGEVLIGLYAMPLWLSKAIVGVALAVLNLRILHIGLFNFLSAVMRRDELAVEIQPLAEHPEEEMI